MGGLAEAMYLATGSIVHRVPAAMTARRALVATLLANGIEWVQNLGGLRVGDSVVVLGLVECPGCSMWHPCSAPSSVSCGWPLQEALG